MTLLAYEGEQEPVNPVFSLPDMESPQTLTPGGVIIPVNVGRVRTHHGLSRKIQELVKQGLGEDFNGSVRIGAIRGVTPSKVTQILAFAMRNGIGGHDIHVDIPRTKH